MNEKIQENLPLVDQFSRTISYLRLSITDQCNLRCQYCMPEELENRLVKKQQFLPRSELLSYEELLRVVRCAASLGMTKLRLTGGEPLLRKGIISFVEALTEIEGLQQIRLTTNGILLGKYAKRLFQMGVRQLNVSLDTLQPEKFSMITGFDFFRQVWASLESALALGFSIKLNVVAMRGVNDDEFLDFARLALDYPFQVRFIEFMPAGEAGSWQGKRFLAVNDIAEKITSLGVLTPLAAQAEAGPAQMFTLKTGSGRNGKIGFISPISHHFCDKCNRLRLTAEGRLRACLLREHETDLKALIRGGALDDDIKDIICKTIKNKPQGHGLHSTEDIVRQSRHDGKMSRIGG